jgi:hypothetical protein
VSPRARHPLCALALLGLLTGCGEDMQLEGSVTSVLSSIKYEAVDVTSTDEEVAVRFIKKNSKNEEDEGVDIILRVSARLDDAVLTPGKPLDLAELLGDELDSPQRGKVNRSVFKEPIRDFPRIARGTLTLDGPLTPQTTVPGSFHVTFVTGTDVYSGRTVFGTFEATVP